MVFGDGDEEGAGVGSLDGLKKVAGGDGSKVGREVGEQLGDALGKKLGNPVGLGAEILRFPIEPTMLLSLKSI